MNSVAIELAAIPCSPAPLFLVGTCEARLRMHTGGCYPQRQAFQWLMFSSGFAGAEVHRCTAAVCSSRGSKYCNGQTRPNIVLSWWATMEMSGNTTWEVAIMGRRRMYQWPLV